MYVGPEFAKFIKIENPLELDRLKLLVKRPNNPQSSSYEVLEQDSILSYIFENKDITVLDLLEQFSAKKVRSSIDDLNYLITQGFIKYYPAPRSS